MAYSSCITEIADNIGIDCANPIVPGYTGRGVLIPYSISPSITRDQTNPRIIRAITVQSGDHVVAVDNVMASPFEGTSKASSADNGRPSATKTFVVRVPRRGADASKDIIEPLWKSAEGYLMIAEKKDKSGEGSYEAVGLLQPLTANADGLTQSEFENGGDTVVTMSCNEEWWDTEFRVDGSALTPAVSDYEATKAAFNALLNLAF